MGIFDKRLNYKPFEYPEVIQFVDSMNSSFRVHKEIDFTADIQDFKYNLTELEQEIVKRILLRTIQVKVGVKLFHKALQNTGIPKCCNITPEQNKPMLWFDEDVFANELDDCSPGDLPHIPIMTKVFMQRIYS